MSLRLPHDLDQMSPDGVTWLVRNPDTGTVVDVTTDDAWAAHVERYLAGWEVIAADCSINAEVPAP